MISIEEGRVLNLATTLESGARSAPDRPAIVQGASACTYAQLDAAANRVANLLRSRDVRPGDKVALSCPNVAHFPIVYFGVLKAGAVVVPLDITLDSPEIAYRLTDSEAVAFFCFEGTPELPIGENGWAGFAQVARCRHFFLLTADPTSDSPIEGAQALGAALDGQSDTFESAPTDAEDTATIVYTARTSGLPKGAELTHASIVLNALTMLRRLGEREHDVQLVALPLFHTFGQTLQLHLGLAARQTLVLLPRFDSTTALATMVAHDVTVLTAVPAMFRELLRSEAPASTVEHVVRTLRLAVSAGSALPAGVHRRFEQRFGVPIVEGYGVTETSPVITFSRPGDPLRIGSAGRPIAGVDIRLVDGTDTEVPVDLPGQILVRGHNVMKGYYRRPKATAEVLRDGWFRTGDVGQRDADGFLYLVDRTPDMISSDTANDTANDEETRPC